MITVLKAFSQLAFVCAFCVNINGDVNLSLSKTSELRRSHFESSTMVIAPSETQDGVRKLPIAEKQARLISQQGRLQGVSISGELQPSHALKDLVASVAENKSVIWISPSRCSKREAEIHNITKEKSSDSVEHHILKVAAPSIDVEADTTTELQLQWALMRRGIAYDQCGLINWNTHQRWVQQLLNLLSKNTLDGDSKNRTDQVVRADRELFTLMAETLQITGEKLTDTPPPIDVCMQKLSTDPRVTMHLLPLPKALKATTDDPGVALQRSTPIVDPPVRSPKVKPRSLQLKPRICVRMNSKITRAKIVMAATSARVTT